MPSQLKRRPHTGWQWHTEGNCRTFTFQEPLADTAVIGAGAAAVHRGNAASSTVASRHHPSSCFTGAWPSVFLDMMF